MLRTIIITTSTTPNNMKDLPKIEWKANNAKFANGKVCFAGLIKIGRWDWNGIDRDLDKKYIANLELPSIKTPMQKFSSEEEAMNFVENTFENWFNALYK